jgi:putative membrane protein
MLSLVKQGLIIILCLFAGVAASRAQDGGTPTVAPFDLLFLRHEIQSSRYELEIARLAQQRAASPDVRAYASTLVNDHEAYDGALRDLASQKGVVLPSGLSEKGRAGVDRLAKLSGRAFDHAFIREARRVNSEALREFRREASRTADPAIRSFVTQYLPMDEKHEDAARGLDGTDRATNAMPVIRPQSGSNMPVIKPPASAGSSMPVIPPPTR